MQHASALEENAAAMEELTTAVRNNADTARQANTLSMTAPDVAVQSGTVVSQVSDTMGAGEQGRGFAVVASEVRTLAQRSAAAAKEIKELIGASMAQVDTGTKLVDRAGATMEEVVTSIGRVTDIMGIPSLCC